jgi:6-methylsalicylate decarboxylase
MTGRIDVHHHVIPPAYRTLLDSLGDIYGGRPVPAWDTTSAIAMMDTHRIATSIVSVSVPGVHWGDDAQARGIARSVNEYTAEMVKDRPDRFGTFASLPLPDVEGATEEAVYALDQLHADGVIVMSNAAGRYLGDPLFEPLWVELDSRDAVVFIHPIEPPMPRVPGIPPPVVDYPFDTTRTAVHLALNGVMRRHIRMKMILSHAGGFLPYVAYRVATTAALADTSRRIDSVLADLRRFYFDIALSANPITLPSLLAFAAPGHVLYGSDWPFVTADYVAYFSRLLDSYTGWRRPDQHHAIERVSAETLFPRIASFHKNIDSSERVQSI